MLVSSCFLLGNKHLITPLEFGLGVELVTDQVNRPVNAGGDGKLILGFDFLLLHFLLFEGGIPRLQRLFQIFGFAVVLDGDEGKVDGAVGSVA